MNATVSLLSQTQELSESDFLEASDAANRREFRRRTARWKSTIVTSDKRVIYGQTVNVSAGGLLLALEQSIAMKDTVLIETEAYYEGYRVTFRASARICHCAMSGKIFHIGCQFIKIADKPLTFLDKFASGAI